MMLRSLWLVPSVAFPLIVGLSGCEQQQGSKSVLNATEPMPLAADLPLPDGRPLPNFTFAGVPGGIPDVPVVVRLADFGGFPGTDVSGALESAAAAAAAQGGGAVLIGPGEFFLDRPVHISHSHVVLRGSGMDATTLTFRWEPERDRVDFIGTHDGDSIPPLRTLIIAAWNDSRNGKIVRCIRRLSLDINGHVVAQRVDSESNEGPWFVLTPDNRQTAKVLREGRNVLRASVEYLDGRTAEKVITVMVREGSGSEHCPRDAAMFFAPADYQQTFYEPISKNVKRGDLRIKLKSVGNLKPGEALMLKGRSVEADCTVWPWYLVAAVEGDAVVLASPVRLDLQLESVRRMPSVTRSGAEDFTIRQISGHWTSLLSFNNDACCWVRRVRMVDAGRFPLTGGRKNFEMRECEVDGAQFHFGVGGGTGYIGFGGCFDGLITHTKTRRLRHAPSIQEGSMGCVIRACEFQDSDAHFHSTPVWENLIENNTINSVGGSKSYGSYGGGFFVCARPPTSYGGSGNVFYRNQVTVWNLRWNAPALLWEGGNGKDILIAGNRFERLSGDGALIQFGGVPTGATITDNIFISQGNPVPLVSGNASGARILHNTFAPSDGQFPFVADTTPAEWSANRFLPDPAQAPEHLPELNPASIFEYQRGLTKSPAPTE